MTFRDLLRRINHHRTTEVYFIGYPKTGNTWIRVMLGRYLQILCNEEQMRLFDSSDWLGRCERSCSGPSMNFTHGLLSWKSQTAEDLRYENIVGLYRDKRVVLIVRHPLDTLVSFWHQERYRSKNGYSLGFEEFVEDKVFGLEKILRFYSMWQDHSGGPKEVKLLHYEKLRADVACEFKSLLEFLKIELVDEVMQQAIEYASFGNMKKLEESEETLRYRSSGLSIFATGDRENPNAHHVRQGEVGSHKMYLSDAIIERCEQKIGEQIGRAYGYGTLPRKNN